MTDDIDLTPPGTSTMRRMTMAGIIQAVAEFYNIPRADIRGKSRLRRHVRPRQIAAYLCKELTEQSYPQIGRSLGGRDHSTMIHACRTIENLMDRDEQLRKDVEELRIMLRFGPTNDNEDASDIRKEILERMKREREQYEAAIAEMNRRIEAYFEQKRIEKQQRIIESMDPIEHLTFKVSEYAKQPLEVRMAE